VHKLVPPSLIAFLHCQSVTAASGCISLVCVPDCRTPAWPEQQQTLVGSSYWSPRPGDLLQVAAGNRVPPSQAGGVSVTAGKPLLPETHNVHTTLRFVLNHSARLSTVLPAGRAGALSRSEYSHYTVPQLVMLCAVAVAGLQCDHGRRLRGHSDCVWHRWWCAQQPCQHCRGAGRHRWVCWHRNRVTQRVTAVARLVHVTCTGDQ
jgi:hypothetical protein